MAFTNFRATLAGQWLELVAPVPPESDYVAVHCNTCGGKNRQDDGWRYRDDPLRRAREQMEQMRAGMTPLMMSTLFPGQIICWPRHTYECDTCRDNHPPPNKDAQDADTGEEDGAVHWPPDQQLSHDEQQQ